MRLFLFILLLGITVQFGYSQYTTVDVRGYVVNDLGEPWSEQQAVLYQGDELVGETNITNGVFEMIGVITSTSHLSLDEDIKVYPNPITLSGVIEIGLDQTQDVVLRIVSLNGQVIEHKTFLNIGAGIHRITFGGQLSSGVYVAVIQAGDQKYSHKFIKTGDANGADTHISSIGAPPLKSGSSSQYTLVIQGPDVNTLQIEHIELPATGSIELSTINDPIMATHRPDIHLRVVDLMDLKDVEGKSVPVDSIPGLEGMRVFLKSDYVTGMNIESICVRTDENGAAILKPDLFGVDTAGYEVVDTLIIANISDSITTYYNFVKPITLKPGEQTIHRQNWDFEGNEPIPLYKQFTDEFGRDLNEYIIMYSEAELWWNHPFLVKRWNRTITRTLEREDGSIVWDVYLKRNSQPQGWESETVLEMVNTTADSINAYAEKKLIWVNEVDNEDDAWMIMGTYNSNKGTGRVVDLHWEKDTTDNRIIYHERSQIEMKVSDQEWFKYVFLQEFAHVINQSAVDGEHLDMVRGTAIYRKDNSLPLAPSTMEKEKWIVDHTQPRSWRPEEYSKDFEPSI